MEKRIHTWLSLTDVIQKLVTFRCHAGCIIMECVPCYLEGPGTVADAPPTVRTQNLQMSCSRAGISHLGSAYPPQLSERRPLCPTGRSLTASAAAAAPVGHPR